MKLSCSAKVTFLPLLLIFCQCENKSQSSLPITQTQKLSEEDLRRFSFSQPHLGTTVYIVFYSHDAELAKKLSQKCFQLTRELNAIFSDYQNDSELSKLCHRTIGKAHTVSKPLFTVIAKAQKISAKTNGAFDITLGKHTQHWRDHFTRKHEVDQSEQASYQDLKLDPDKRTITLLKPLKLDLGGIAKGYIADQLMLILENADITHAAVIIGGETVLASAPPGKNGWRIGIENPEKQIIATLSLENTCLSTSGDSYQFFEQDGERQSHLIDPTTKKSKVNRLNVTTIAPSAMEADAWATALRILPTEKSIPLANQQPKLQALFLPYQKKPIKTNGFPSITKP